MICKHYGCKNEAEADLKQCREHLDAAKAYQQERRKKFLEEGKCTRCGEESRPSKTMCQKCADSWNSYLKVRRNSKKGEVSDGDVRA